MYLSVILPTLNRSRLLTRALLSLVQQICSKEYEIIVVDNGSKDGTKHMVKKINKLFGRKIKYLYDARPGSLIGRHVGAKRAQGDILSFVDDDIIVPPHWVEGIYNVFADHDECV